MTPKQTQIYTAILSALVPGSALAAIIRPCPVAALVCGVLAIALAWEQYRVDRKRQEGNAERIAELQIQLDSLKDVIRDLNVEAIIARSEEMRTVLNGMKLNNLYSRK